MVTMATPAEAQAQLQLTKPRCARARRSVLPVLRAAGADIASADGRRLPRPGTAAILTLAPETADIRPMAFPPENANAPLRWPKMPGGASTVHVRDQATGRHGRNFERARWRRKCRSTIPAPITSPAPVTRRPLSAARRGRRSTERKRRRLFRPGLNRESQGLSAPSPRQPREHISQCPLGVMLPADLLTTTPIASSLGLASR